MGRGVQLEIKFAFLIIFSQHFCPELSEKQEQKLKRFTFQDGQKFLRKPFRRLRLSQYDYYSEATLPGCFYELQSDIPLVNH